MALHNSFKQGQSQQQGTRLAALPSTDDLGQALSQAGKSGKRPVIVSWKSSKSSAVFWLSVTASGVGNDVEWLLQKGEENTQPKDVWTHKTADTKLIQSLIAAEDEMASKGYRSGQRPQMAAESPEAEPPANGNSENSGSNAIHPGWNVPGGNAPIVMGGGFQSQPPRGGQNPITPQWQGAEAPPWNAPKATEEHISWGANQAPKPDPNNPNPFSALKGTVEEPKPNNPFNALVSNPSLPQLPQQELPGSSLPKDDPSANPYDALTSGQGIKKMPAATPPPPVPPVTKSSSPFTISNSAVPQAPAASHVPVPRVPDFAAMTSSGAFPVVSVPAENALNPKAPAKKEPSKQPPFVINEVAAPVQEATSSPIEASMNSGSTPVAPPPAPGQPSTPLTPPAPPQTQSNSGLPLAPSTRTSPLPPPVELDRHAVDAVFKTLSNPDTGLLTHSSLLFFLVREFNRFQVSKEPFSLFIIELNVLISGSGGQQLPRPLPPRAVRAATEKLFKVTRQLDLVAHYEQHEFAMLLPTTSRQQAAEFAQTVSKSLLGQPLLPDMEPKSLVLHMGVASFPEDTSHPGILLAAARDAKLAAQRAGKPIMLFSET